ncbi:hypothetical protein GCM10009122_34530 [Fulvivirga kasyanovii]|uniref:hypothetical protein n=2 Tax=Fulvivirga kasyanovii TaxID=396812 RepID=UPI0031D1319D
MSASSSYCSFVQCSKYLAYVVIGVAIAVLIGWQFNIGVLKRVIPGLVAMNPLTAICFIMSATSLLLFSFQSYRTTWAKAVALGITVICIIKISGMVLGIENNIDELLFHDKLQVDVVVGNTNSMAPNTALCFMIIGLALFYLPYETSKGKRVSEIMSIHLTINRVLQFRFSPLVSF